MDGANWLAHYADHRLGPLWRFHALHHSQEELSVLTSFRAHPLMHTTGFLLATIPVAALMPARPIAPVIITIYVCIGTLQHVNLRWTFGPAGRVLVSPAYHRLHHAQDTQQTESAARGTHGVPTAQVDLISRALESETHRLVRRATIQIVFQRDDNLLKTRDGPGVRIILFTVTAAPGGRRRRGAAASGRVR